MSPAKRVKTIVEGEWGRATTYDPDEEVEEPAVVSVTKHRTISSFISISSSKMFYDPDQEEQSIIDVTKSEKIHTLAEKHDPYGLPHFLSSLFATVLEDTITELRILTECNTEIRISKIMYEKVVLLAIKYGVKQPVITDELAGIDPHNLGCDEYKINKLDSDRKYLSDVLTSTYIDFTMNHSYEAIANYVNKIVSTNNHCDFVIEDEAKNKIHRRELKKHLRQQRNHIKSVTYDMNVTIDNLKTEVEDASLNAEIRTRYVTNWQQARTEQHVQSIHDKESEPSGIIEHYKERSDHERRVHSEVELLINIAINETLEKVEEWMNKYDRDMEEIDLKIQIQKHDYQTMLDKRVGLEKTLVVHAKLMKEWIHFKDEREKARAYVEKMYNSAITVQAWWRGMLVRKQLGPFRPKRKPKGKAKK